MKNSKKILILLLSLTLVFTLFACGKCKHADEDKNGVCDKCGEEMELDIADVALIEDGVANFQFVMENGVSSDIVKAVDGIIKALKGYDVKVERVADKADNVKDIEVLIGDITTRDGKYSIDKHALGPKGYAIKIVDSKIIINAGSYSQLAEAVEVFGDEILGLAEDPDELWYVAMSASQMVEVIQNEYRITSLKVNGVDMKGYTIAVDSTNSKHVAAAESFQKLAYERAGYWFEMVAPDKADKSIIFTKVEKSADFPNGFEIRVNDKSQIVIKCAYDNMIEEGLAKFTSAKISTATGDVEFATGVLLGDFNASIVSYDAYGAKGDGVTDDYAAIYKAHVLANEGGQTVVATAGKTYYLESPVVNGKLTSIPVKTNVDWQGAKFIIDDRRVLTTADTKNWNLPVFSIEQDQINITYSAENADHKAFLKAILEAGLNRDTTKIDLGDRYRCPVMIITENKTHKVYRRRKYAAYTGAAMQEVIVLDKDGNIVGGTDVMYDYIDLTGLSIVKLDEITPITVKNGEFTTRASKHNCITVASDGYRSSQSYYLTRGLSILRSYTTVENVKHYVTDEVPLLDCIDENDNNKVKFVGACYRGFYVVGKCTDVTIKNCILTGRRAYRTPDGGTGGTYDLSAGLTNNVVFEGCVQSNFWVTIDSKYNVKPAKEGDEGAINGMNPFPNIKATVDDGRPLGCEMHWGIGGTNLCKNTKYINSTLSRYDAHEGTYGGEVVGSTVSTVALTGGGDFYIKDSKIIPDVSSATVTTVFGLREDYGYTWAGTVYIENVSAIVERGKDLAVTKPEPDKANWYWGYYPTMPSIVIKDLVYYYSDSYNPQTKEYAKVPSNTSVYLYGNVISADSRAHLPTTKGAPMYSLEDKNDDGYIDIPDYDGDGIWGDTNLKFDEIKEALGRNYDKGIDMSLFASDLVTKPDGLYENLAQVTPPEFVKILSNKGGYRYYVRNTGNNAISSGGHHGVNNNKGLYGSTKFYYSDTEYYQGPPSASEKIPDENLYVFY